MTRRLDILIENARKRAEAELCDDCYDDVARSRDFQDTQPP